MSKKVLELDPNEVKVPEDRYRKKFNHEEMEALKSSIVELGQIQPIRITRNKVLVVGERRLRACLDLNLPIQAVYVDHPDAFSLLKMEYEENARRSPLTPQEDILAVDRLYRELEDIKSKPPTHEEVAEVLGKSKTQVTEDLKLACYLKAAPQHFEKCKTKHDMRKTVGRFEQQVHFARLEKALDSQPSVIEEHDGPIEIKDVKVEDPRASHMKVKIEEYKTQLKVGDAYQELPGLEGVGVMFLDPGWGIEHHTQHKGGQSTYDDTEKTFKDQFFELARLAFGAMSDNSHLYCFFGIVHHEFVYRSLEDAGFFVNRRPIIVCKEGRSHTRAAYRWNGAGYEPVVLAHKGDRRLVRQGDPDWFVCPWTTAAEKLGHPNAKPPEVYRRFLLQSAYPGDLVCDPMFGSGSAFVACELVPQLRLKWIGWDKEPDNRAKALYNLMQNQPADSGQNSTVISVGEEED